MEVAVSFMKPIHRPYPNRFSLPCTRHKFSSKFLINTEYQKRQSSSVAVRLRVRSSSTAGALSEGVELPSSNVIGKADLLIVGPGILGRIVAKKWREMHPGCQIFGQTITTDHHEELKKNGINPSLIGRSQSHKFPFVIFCAPSSRSSDYPNDVRLAASTWSGEGSFLFTSSSVTYDCNDNGLCNEESPTVPLGISPRTDILLKAENAVLDAGGCILRLAGLYQEDRGAHMYWLRKRTVDARPDHILNLIHYDDAASLSIAILKKNLQERIFLGCDNYPLSRQELMDCVNKSGKFSTKFEGFTGTDDPLGKRLNNSKTRGEIGWEPKNLSFPDFLGIPH